MGLDEECYALTDVFQGMHGLLSLTQMRKRGYRFKSGSRKNIADRLSVSVLGMKTYLKCRTKRMRSFLCCLESMGGTRQSTLQRRIDEVERQCNKMIELYDKLARQLPKKHIPQEQIQESATHVLETVKAEFPKVGDEMRDMENILREQAESTIMGATSAKDEFMSRLARMAAKSPTTIVDDFR